MQADILRYCAEHTQKYNDEINFNLVLPETYLKENNKETENRHDWKPKEPLKIIYKLEAWKHYKKARYISKQLADQIAYSDKKNQIDSIQLGLALNYAVFLWEIVQSPEQKK